MADRDVEDLLDDVLEHVEDGRVIPIIGEELLCVSQDGQEFPLYGYVARKLAERLDVPFDASVLESDLTAVVCKYWETGRQRSAVYTKLKLILNEARFQPPQALLDLASIDRLKLFIVLTFDDLLAKGINQVRGLTGDSRAVELAYSPGKSDDLPKQLSQPVVYHLFGKLLSAQPDEYVVTDEDALEFLHHMQRGPVPVRLFDALRENHLLFIGCTFSDWLARFLIRIARRDRLSQGRSATEALVGSGVDRDRDLIVFLRHFSPSTRMVVCSPAEFVAALFARYRERRATAEPPMGHPARLHAEEAAEPKKAAVFLSYYHEDVASALRLSNFLDKEAGIDVWFDEDEIKGGDGWDLRCRRNITKCSYFMPLISTRATRTIEGYFRTEWKLAVARADRIRDDVPFIIPVVIDDTPMDVEGVPEHFKTVRWMRLPHGNGNEDFLLRMIELARNYERRMRG
jgi:hypothetical protein